MKKKNKLPNFIILIILTLITVVFWVSFDIFRVFTTKAVPVVSDEIVEPLNPKLDVDTLDQIEKRGV